MDPRDTPGYRLHRALTNLNRIETTKLDDADRERIETARTALQDVSLLTHLDNSGVANSQFES